MGFEFWMGVNWGLAALCFLGFWVGTGRAWLCWLEAYGLVVFIDQAGPLTKFITLLFWPVALVVWLFCEWMDV